MRPTPSAALIALLLLLPSGSRADTYERQPGIDVLRYEIDIELGDESDVIRASTRLHVRMQRDGVEAMWLDFGNMTVERLRAGGADRPFVHERGRISFTLDRSYSSREIAVIEVDYRGEPAGTGLLVGRNNHGRRVFFAENWPDRARHWFPSIDHPSDKAAVDFTVTAPERYDVVANGHLVETRSLLDGRRRTRWREENPIPTYCMVIGVAEFAVRPAGTVGSVPLIWYAFPPDAEAAERKFQRSSLALQFFIDRVGAYPYAKLAQVQSSTRIGGMENAGAVFYAERAFQRPNVSEAPVPHEIAHQWFGNSVTPADWDHLWLSEGFATYFDALFYEHLEGPDALRSIMTRGAEAVRDYHSRRASPVIDPAQTDLMQKLNANTYQKGAWILHMLRRIVGEESFLEGIRRYYRLHAGGTVLSEDFHRVMEAASGIPLTAFFRQWLYQPGSPDYRVSWAWDEGAGAVEIEIRQQQTSGLFDMPLEIVIRSPEGVTNHTARVADAVYTIRLPFTSPPESIEVDPGGWVLGSVTVEPR